MNINSSPCHPPVCYIYPLLVFLLLCLHPSCSSRPPLHRQLQAHRYRPLPDHTKDWSSKIGNSSFTYASLAAMLSKKKSLSGKIAEHISSIQQQSSISPGVLLKMNILAIYQRELRASENSLVTVLKDLNQTLSSDYGSIENIKKTCHMRQEDMRNAAILVEEDYNIILDLEKELSSIHTNSSSVQSHFKLVNEFLSEISQAADTLEKNLVEDVFREYKNMQGAGLETVIKLSKGSLHEHNMKLLQDGSDKTGEGEAGQEEGGRGISMLIDSSSNQYILSRPRDVTFPVEDHHFIHDIINLLLLSFVLGGVCSLVTIPSLFGCMFAGMVLGPTGWNVVGSVVQVESLGEVGVIFIVFTVGLDFSFQKLQNVWRVAVYGGNLLLALGILLAILLGVAFQVHPQQSLFVATCLSFSSNPLATRIVNRTSASTRRARDSSSDSSNLEASGSEVVDSVRGVLSMQDIQLGVLMALLPFFGAGKGHTHMFSVARFLQLLQVLFGLPALVLVVRSLATRVIGRFYRQFSIVMTSRENVLFGSIALCLGTVLVAELMSGSLELGCFLAGVVISSHGTVETKRVKKLTGPIRDLFSVFFFASLGFHVYPTFLRSEFSTMGTVMVCIVTLKFLLSMLVFGMFLGYNQRDTFILSVSLAQVSEFSFVVASRARRMNIISREVYLVVLSVTTLSLLLSPLLWRVLLLNRLGPSIVRGISFHSINLSSRICSLFTGRLGRDCAA